MSDIMKSIPFGQLMEWILAEHKETGQVFGIQKAYVADPSKTAEIFREKGCPTAEACEDVEEAFKKALAAKGEDGMLFCVGSLYLVGEIKTLILQGVGK